MRRIKNLTNRPVKKSPLLLVLNFSLLYFI